MIALDGVTVQSGSFGLTGVSLEVPSGEYACLMGATGAGKTTLLEAVCGLRRVTSGRITVGGRDVTTSSAAERGIGYVPQDGALFPAMRVAGQIAFAAEVRGASRAEARRIAEEWADRLGVTSLLHRTVDGLSGGERQRVALGRALASRPTALLLDEPLAALDDDTSRRLRRLLRDVHQETGVTVLHVTHRVEEADDLASVRFRLVNGQVARDVPS